jgi:hypothetical protein
MSNQILSRMYRSIPFRMACELHQRLRSGCNSAETQKMLREAMRQAGFVRRVGA